MMIQLKYTRRLFSNISNPSRLLFSDIQIIVVKWILIAYFLLIVLFMIGAFLPPILTPVVTLVFPGLVFALFFALIEQEN